MENNYLSSIKKQFAYYKLLGDRTFEQLSDEDLFKPLGEDVNSIAIIVNHLSGNMKSRFTDFLTSDGEKEWRNRDEEFLDLIKNRKQLLKYWEDGWKIVFEAIDQIQDLNTIVYIRNQGHTVTEALNRQMAHYAYHVGQIVLVGKFYSGHNWKSLTIPKGDSKAFNKAKFDKEKSRGHFTDDFLGS